MVNRCDGFGSGDGDGSVRVLSIDLEECRDLMMACMMTRMQSLGWTEREARSAADAAIAKMTERAPRTMERVAQVCGAAAAGGEKPHVMTMLARAEFALSGFEIADELNKSRIAGMN